MPTVNLYCGTPEQIEIVTSDARFLGVFAGRRYGKTFTLANRLMARCLSKQYYGAWYIGNTYAQTDEVYRMIAGVPELQPLIADARHQPYPKIIFRNKSYIAFRSFDRPENLRGSGLDEVCCDEIQDYNETHFWPVIRPLISDRRGRLVVAGQFRGENWYFKQFYERGQKDTTGIYKSWRLPSRMGFVFQNSEGRKELELARQQLPKIVYEQEYECVPIANQFALFDHDDIKKLTRGVRSGPQPNKTYIIGFDLGRTVDPSAVVVLEQETGQVVHAEKFPLRQKHEIQAQKLKLIVDRFKGQLIVDSTGGATGGKRKDSFVTEYRQVIPNLREFVWTRDSKTRMIQHLCLEVEQGRFSIPPTETEFLDEMLSYEAEYKGGAFRYSAPDGKHDDYVAALAMAIWGRNSGWGPKTGGRSLGTMVW